MPEKKARGRKREILPGSALVYEREGQCIVLLSPSGQMIRWPDGSTKRTMYAFLSEAFAFEIVQLIADLHGLRVEELEGRRHLTYVFKERP